MTEHATPDHGERAHAVLSASGADRWLNCPGSVALTRDMPDTSSSYAEWGTTCHELGELALRNRLLGEKVVFESDKYDAEMYAAVAAYRNFAEGILAEHDEEPLIWIECPRLLFPFSRQILAEVTREGGYPPLLINPIDFTPLYWQELRDRQGRSDVPLAATRNG